MKILWFDREFLRRQSATLHFFDFRDLTIPFVFDENDYRIGFIGPYSCAFTDGNLLEDTANFTLAYEAFINDFDPSSIAIRLPVKRHFTKYFEVNVSALDSLGFFNEYIDVNSSVILTSHFRSNYNRNRIRDLGNKLFSKFEILSGQPSIAYNLIELNRRQKGIEMSLPFDKFNNNIFHFPNRFQTKVCLLDGIPAAAVILVNVDERIQYVFMWGHDRSMEHSGLALFRLADDVFESAFNSGFEIVCLGTSSISGQVDSGLLQFKKSLGAEVDLRYTLRWNRLRYLNAKDS